MIEVFEAVVPAALCDAIQSRLSGAEFVDGNATAGSLDGGIKNNLQLPGGSQVAKQISRELISALGECKPLGKAIRMAAITPPRVSRYDPGMYYGEHFDNALMRLGPAQLIRTDISMTICLNDASDYEGGSLQISTQQGEQEFRGSRGDVVIYPGGQLHRVTEVTSGSRLVAVAWAQSLIRDWDQRAAIRNLEEVIAASEADGGSLSRNDTLKLRRTLGYLVRRWSEP